MTNIRCILITLSFVTAHILSAQSKFNYDQAWQRIDSLLAKQLPKTAAPLIDKLYLQARADKQEAQLLKAIIAKGHLLRSLQEDEYDKTIALLEQELKQNNTQPLRQLLHSLLADVYYDYLDAKRWQIMERQASTRPDPKNPATWSVQDFDQRIWYHYQASLQNASLLQATSLQAYDPILLKGQRQLRPTLYDLLAHKALDYLEQDSYEGPRPQQAFLLDDAAALAPPQLFVRHRYQTADSTHRLYKAIVLYQQLLSYRLTQPDTAALIDLDMRRYRFVKSNSTNPHKQQLLKEWLEHTWHQYPTQPEAAQAGLALAEWWQQKGNAYQPAIGTAEDKMALVQAARLAMAVSQRHPGTRWAEKARYLLATLQKPALRMQVEKVNAIQLPFRARLSFTNTNVVYLRLIPKNKALEDVESNGDENWWKHILKQPALRQWQQVLPTMNDYRQHSAEIKIEPLPAGEYWLVASTHPNFTTVENALSAVFFHVSNIAYVQHQRHLYVLHRQTGLPLPKATVQLWQRRYDYNKRRYIDIKGELLTTDNNGLAMLPNLGKGSRYEQPTTYEISHQQDRLHTRDGEYYYERGWDDEEQEVPVLGQKIQTKHRYFLFTDRGLYRPGQTLYFKAIGVAQNPETKLSELYLPATEVEVQLFNANNQLVSSQRLQPNEYGSINGSFALPSSGLTGQFRVEVQSGDQRFATYVRVEEYKRPRFEVKLLPITGEYRLNQVLVAKGMAAGFAGNAIDGAEVRYRVFRQTQMPFYFYRSYPSYSGGSRQEIASGTLRTAADGSFQISFTALPDLSVDARHDPSFVYSIEASVTDASGETHDTRGQVTVGYKSLQLTVEGTDETFGPADQPWQLQIKRLNMNGEPVKAAVTWQLYRLQAPNRPIRQRLWPAPDTTVLTRAEFEQLFPYDAYAQEDDWRQWPLGEQVSAATLPDSSLQLSWPAGSLAAGMYALLLHSTDANGQPVTARHYLGVYDMARQQLPAPLYQLQHTQLGSLQPGEQARLVWGSWLKPVFVINTHTRYRRRQAQTEYSYGQPAQPLEMLQPGATEDDRGGFSLGRVFVQHGRVYQAWWQVAVPWTNKQLEIELTTFRNKLLPGQQETWRLHIKGDSKDKVAAELLATMYDASLDAIQRFDWQQPYWWPNNYREEKWLTNGSFGSADSRESYWEIPDTAGIAYSYDQMMRIDRYWAVYGAVDKVFYAYALQKSYRTGTIAQAALAEDGMAAAPAPAMAAESRAATVEKFTQPTVVADVDTKAEEKPGDAPGVVPMRKRFNETAFWLPQLYTDSSGNVQLSFTMPEALTRWRLLVLAHTRQLQVGYREGSVITQKELMVQPNLPRFLRQGDRMELVSKVVNLSQQELTGTATLELLNASTMQPVDGWLQNVFPQQFFTVPAGQSVAVRFPIQLPVQYTDAVVVRISAKAGQLSDGEETALPVLADRMLVTETLPINLQGSGSKTVRWQKLLQANQSPTLQHQALTLEFTSNPAWLAIQSLPYLTEYPYDCAEQTWNRFFANALAARLLNSHPRIKAIVQRWQGADSAALLSALQKNEELKQALLEETPWVLAANNEADQKRQLATLFDALRMATEASKALTKLEELQSPNGGFVWFKGGPDDRYMTQYIAAGIGHLRKLEAWPEPLKARLEQIARRAIAYLDARLHEDYERLLKSKRKANNTIAAYDMQVQHLYMRSFFTDITIKPAHQAAYQHYLRLLPQQYAGQTKQTQAMIALVLHRIGQRSAAQQVLNSLRQTSLLHPELGRYWKELNNPGYYWWQAPIESQALLIEAFSEVASDTRVVDELKTWLLKNKQTTHWKTTRATAEACYALLLQGSLWLASTPTIQLTAGSWQTSSKGKTEAGTGYFKQTLPGDKVKAEMGTISVQLRQPTGSPANMPVWGAAYWQYFEDMDKITSAASSLHLEKNLLKEVMTPTGPQLQPLEAGTDLRTGDKLVVRLTLRTDRALEYVHLKDMRAACFEPITQVSGYQWQEGLSYYQAPRDASMNFFISYLPRGTWVIDYPLRAAQVGEFSNGISSLQCMYAPEFSSHSTGQRVTVNPPLEK